MSETLRVGARVLVEDEGVLYHGRIVGMRVVGDMNHGWVAVKFVVGGTYWCPAYRVAIVCGVCPACEGLAHRTGCMQWIGDGAVAAALGV